MSLEASDDLKSWQPARLRKPSCAWSRTAARCRSRGSSSRARKAKYLRVTASHRGLRAHRAARGALARRAAPLLLHSVTVGGAQGKSPASSLYDLQAAIPVSRVQLVLAEPNVVAPVQLFARNDDGDWRDVGSATFYRLAREGEEVRSPPIDVPPAPARYWMVRIDPKAGVPSDAPRLEAGYRSRQIVFVSRGDGPYLLVFGHDGGEAREPAVGDVDSGLRAGQGVFAAGCAGRDGGVACPAGGFFAGARVLGGARKEDAALGGAGGWGLVVGIHGLEAKQANSLSLGRGPGRGWQGELRPRSREAPTRPT